MLGRKSVPDIRMIINPGCLQTDVSLIKMNMFTLAEVSDIRMIITSEYLPTDVSLKQSVAIDGKNKQVT